MPKYMFNDSSAPEDFESMTTGIFQGEIEYHMVYGSHHFITAQLGPYVITFFFDRLKVKEIEFEDHYQMAENVRFFMQPKSQWSVADRVEVFETEFDWFIVQWYKDEVLVSFGPRPLVG